MAYSSHDSPTGTNLQVPVLSIMIPLPLSSWPLPFRFWPATANSSGMAGDDCLRWAASGLRLWELRNARRQAKKFLAFENIEYPNLKSDARRCIARRQRGAAASGWRECGGVHHRAGRGTVVDAGVDWVRATVSWAPELQVPRHSLLCQCVSVASG